MSTAKLAQFLAMVVGPSQQPSGDCRWAVLGGGVVDGEVADGPSLTTGVLASTGPRAHITADSCSCVENHHVAHFDPRRASLTVFVAPSEVVIHRRGPRSAHTSAAGASPWECCVVLGLARLAETRPVIDSSLEGIFQN